MTSHQIAASFAVTFLAALAQPHLTAESKVPTSLTVHDATPVRLKLTQDLFFSKLHADDPVDFQVMDDLRIDDVLVLARGAHATGTITVVEPKTRTGRGGKLGVNLAAVLLMNGSKLPLRAAKPTAPSLLFSFGRDESFPEGSIVMAFTDGETNLDPGRFLVDMQFTSKPAGALVTMYGAPIGHTPFTTRLAPGAYQATFSVTGYTDLRRTIVVGPGESKTAHAAFDLNP